MFRDLDRGLIRAVALTGANVPDARAAEDIKTDLEPQEVVLDELHLDRSCLTSTLVRDREPCTAIYCKPWPMRNGGQFPKTAFALDWQKQAISCPNEVTVLFEVRGVVHFPPETCAACLLRGRCTRSEGQGPSVLIHPDEKLLFDLRRVAVVHNLHVLQHADLASHQEAA